MALSVTRQVCFRISAQDYAKEVTTVSRHRLKIQPIDAQLADTVSHLSFYTSSKF